MGNLESQPVVPAGGPSQIAGIDPALAKKLAKIGLHSRFDLILHLPLRYEDETRVTPLAEVIDGQSAQIEVTVATSEIAPRPRRQLVCRVEDATGAAILRFLHFYPSQLKSFVAGARLRAFGELRTGFFGAEMIHPRVRVLRKDEPLPTALTPVYPTTAGVSQYQLRTLVERALASEALTDTLPDGIREPLGLMPFRQAIDALQNLRARAMVPMHWGAFQLTDEPLREPIERLLRAWEARRPVPRLQVLAVGETVEVA